MSAVEYDHRITVEMVTEDRRPYVATWRNVPDGPEAACFQTRSSATAKQIWNALRLGQHPAAIRCSLKGWAGVHITPVVIYARWARDEGWGSWEVVGDLEGTRHIRHGVMADPDPAKFDDTTKEKHDATD